MNNTEIIIKYLSGDLDSQMHSDFEKSLTVDQELADEFRSIELIWKIAKQHLTLNDLPDCNNREEFIASVLAAHDVEKYRTNILTAKEKTFKKELDKVHNQFTSEETPSRNRSGRKPFKIYAFVAAAAATLLYLLLPGSDYAKLADSYYNPQNDPRIEELVSITRSSEINGISFFMEGNYKAAIKRFEKNTSQLNSVETFCYAISCYESGEKEKGILLLRSLITKENNTIASRAKWYLSLVLIETGDTAEAKELLGEIVKTDETYKSKAKKLSRRMK